MRTFRSSLASTAIAAAAAIVMAGCGGAGGPSIADVQTALAAGDSVLFYGAPPVQAATFAGNTFSPPPYTDGGVGTATVVYTVTSGTAQIDPWSATGSITYVNWHDAITGYTINGTIAVSGSFSSTTVSQTVQSTMTSNLTLTGGPVTTLVCDVSVSITLSLDGTVMIAYSSSGIVRANGRVYDYTKLD